MAAIANTLQTYQTVGIREDLSDAIYNISPTDTPFLTGAGRGSADNTLYEWQTDALAAPDTNNAFIEGDEATFQAVTPTVRLGNYTQISRKTIIVAGTQEAVKKAGRKSDLAYNMAKRSKELKRDMEAIMLSNQGAAAGAAGVPRKTGTLLAFVKTNVNKGATGANPVYTSIPTGTRTDGTQRDFTEPLLKDVLQLVWASGGDVDGSIVMVGPVNKQKASLFSGIATKTLNSTGAKKMAIVAAADIYVSDFGTTHIIPNRFQRERDAHVIDFDFVQIDYLRSFRTEKLAKTGDAEKRMLLAEYGLRVKNEAALGLIADLTTA